LAVTLPTPEAAHSWVRHADFRTDPVKNPLHTPSGPPATLASRLVDAAEPGGIRLDESTAMAILRSPEAARDRVGQCHEVVAKGLGQIVPWSLERTSPTRH